MNPNEEEILSEETPVVPQNKEETLPEETTIDFQEEMATSAEDEQETHQPALEYCGDYPKDEPEVELETMTTQEVKRNNIIYIIIAAVFVLVGLAAVAFNSGLFDETAQPTSSVDESVTAITINGVDYSAAEVNYHVVNSYQSFVNSYYDYLSYFGLDLTVSLKDQTSIDGSGTWYDYFLDQGISQMSTIIALVDEAQSVGYVYDESVEQSKVAYLAELEMYAPYYGYDDGSAYLAQIYGDSMTMELYEKLLEQSLQAEAYSYAFQDSLVYDEATLQALYAADPNAYDMVDCEYIYIYNEVPTVDDEGNAIEVTEEMSAAALAEAKAVADELYQDYTEGAAMSAVVESSDLANYGGAFATAYTADIITEWLFDDSRQPGDSAILEDTDYGIFYMVEFQSRYLEDYNLVNVRHILTMPATGTLTTDDEGYAEELVALDAAALESAQAIYDMFLSGDQSEDSFATLANSYSEDTGSNTTGGLYAQVAMGEMVAEFEDWCFDANRKVGDTGIVATTYGYHVMYFSGYDLPYWQYNATYTLMEADYTAWMENLQNSITIEYDTEGMASVGSTL